LIGLFFIHTIVSSACSCEWGGNFIKSAKSTNGLVFKGKVIGSFYHFEDNTVVISNDQEGLMKKLIDENLDFRQFIEVEIEDIIKGNTNKKTIRIYGSDGSDCLSGIHYFDLYSTYIFLVYNVSFELNQNILTNHYGLSDCSESFLKYH